MLFGLTVLSPCFVAFGDNDVYEGVIGQTKSVDRQTGGGTVGQCKDKKEHERCTTKNKGLKTAFCEYSDKARKDLSCTTFECNKGYVLHLGYGFCRTIAAANDFCKSKVKCDVETEEPVAKIIPNPKKNNKGKPYTGDAFKDCFCANKNMVIYKCGDGATGTPPTDSKTYTNMEDVTLKANTCKKTGATFTGWECGDYIKQPGDVIHIENGITCIAQWTDNQYTVTFDWGDSNPETVKYTYGTDVELPNVGDHTKDGHIFSGWTKGNENFVSGQSVSVIGDATYVARWTGCDACNPGEGCTCEIVVKNNECKYIATPKSGYVIQSVENPKQPQCILASEKNCNDSGGEWANGICKCNPDVPNATWDGKKCVCNDSDKIIKDNRCVVPTTCPDDATGTYPKCNCTSADKKYDERNNTCIPRCNDSIAIWNVDKCVCKDPGKEYKENTDSVSKSTCECPADKPMYVNKQCVTVGERDCIYSGGEWVDGECRCPQNTTEAYWDITHKKCVCKDKGKEFDKNTNTCVVPTTCPDDATGTYPECNCNDPEKTYNEVKNICECPLDKPDDGSGNCVEPKRCPSDSVGTYPKCRCNDADKKYDRNKNECVIDELKKAYDDARAKEQSKENRMLTAATTAATGLGGMELARGFSEQQADKNAQNDMLGYVSTFRCEYGKGNNVMGGPDEVQLPVIDLTNNKTKYKELAESIKVRKAALGMKPGLESEEILERTTLYDEENIGITGSSLEEGSIYRAEILGIASDQEKIKSSSEATDRRIKGGAATLGGGIVGGITGNSAINGELGEKIKEIKDKKSDNE